MRHQSTDSGYRKSALVLVSIRQNRYAIEYKLDSAVGGYTDKDGVNFRCKRWNEHHPHHVRWKSDWQTVTTDEIAHLWGFDCEDLLRQLVL